MSIAEPEIPSLQIVAEQFRAEIFAYIQSKVVPMWLKRELISCARLPRQEVVPVIYRRLV